MRFQILVLHQRYPRQRGGTCRWQERKIGTCFASWKDLAPALMFHHDPIRRTQHPRKKQSRLARGVDLIDRSIPVDPISLPTNNMRFSTFLGFLISAVAMISTSAVQAPQSHHQCSSSGRVQSLFGSRQRWSLENIRGGAVVEPESADAVSSLLLDAASENKLVVIDFSATWW